MLGFKQNNEIAYPVEVVTTLQDLMRYEFLVQSGSLLPKHPVYAILAGRHTSKLRGRGLDFEEVRQYVAGDDIRNIDWRVTARTGKTHSKVFNEEKERPTFIVVDQSSFMFFGSQRFVKSVSAAHAAAVSAFYTIKRGDRVGGIVFNEEGYDYIAPKRSKALVQHFLQTVVSRNKVLPLRKTVQANTSLLNTMLQRTQAAVTHDYVITVISDFSMIDEQTRQYLRNMSNHNDVILIHIYDLLDEKLPDGKLILSDGKRQIAWQNSKNRWGAKYPKNFTDMRKTLTEEFDRYRIPMVFFNTTETIEDQVMQSMGRLLRR
ncbi:DUF58 domain-containing protein [Mucilaginibacter sp. X4EP1]|uniref:DUF58 domain-containing protein n=1 Tax=Mucilaginibacter sp. X4EP1 TaxID=2723092 RepID=UPI0021693907|nr:DUF58 domain-containing protein [Mucilaginibacter sp. X4EP1]MCS3813580.1 uncharacterized protein (DUF58 family) [Mucilaginibacter sp. X4EP1]